MTLDLPNDLVARVKLLAEQEEQKLKDTVAALLRTGLAALSSGSPAVVNADKSMLARRKELTRKFIAGEWGVELADFEIALQTDRRKAGAARQRNWFLSNRALLRASPRARLPSTGQIGRAPILAAGRGLVPFRFLRFPLSFPRAARCVSHSIGDHVWHGGDGHEPSDRRARDVLG